MAGESALYVVSLRQHKHWAQILQHKVSFCMIAQGCLAPKGRNLLAQSEGFSHSFVKQLNLHT